MIISYFFRFEEPDKEFIKKYPRVMTDTVRITKKSRRKIKRERKQREKEEEKKKERVMWKKVLEETSGYFLLYICLDFFLLFYFINYNSVFKNFRIF